MAKRPRPLANGELIGLIQASQPSVAIFDLDSTLWNGNVENFSAAQITGRSEATDSESGRTLRLFPEARTVLDEERPGSLGARTTRSVG